MKSKSCADCKHFNDKTWGCSAWKQITRPQIAACELFRGETETLFDRIIVSPEVLAPKLVYSVLAEDICTSKKTRYYYSTITGQRYDEESEAIAATVARLKEVAE